MKDKVSSVIVEVADNNCTRGGHILHEQEYNTGHGIPAIPDEICRKIWRQPGQPEVQQEPVVHLLLESTLGWNGVVWYLDEQGTRKRKSFCGTTKQKVKEKITAYLADFDRQLIASDESKARLEESMGRWLRVFKFPSVERGTYDRLECTAKHQIYPIIGSKVVDDITSADIINKFKAEALRTWSNGERIYQQAAAYTLMLNTGLRTGEVLGLLNSDIDLENRVLHLQKGVKEVARREGTNFTSGREVKVGKLKTASSKRDVPLNQAAVDAILDLRAERYFGEDTPLISDEHGDYTRSVNFRKRYYRILDAAGLEQRGLHTLRHTFATNLVNGVKQPDGSLKALSPRQAADLLGHPTLEITELYYVKKNTPLAGDPARGAML